MSDVPEAAVEAAAQAIAHSWFFQSLDGLTTWAHKDCYDAARAALPAAMPALREHIAQEILQEPLPKDVAYTVNVKTWFVEGAHFAARIVRKGTPGTSTLKT